MARLRQYSDPTFSGVKGSNIVYPSARASKGSIRALGTDNLEDKVDNLSDEGFDPSKLKALVPYASNIVNSFRKLPKPIMSPTETPITPELVNYDAARNNIDVDQRNLNKETDYRVTNPAVAQALKAVNAGQAIAGRNQLAMGEANTNAQIKNQTKQFNQGIFGRNIQRRADFNNELVSRNIEQQNLISDNIANVGDKFQLGERDRALMSLEERKLSYLPEFYEKDASGSSPYDRFVKRNKTNVGQEVQTNRYGGRIKRFRNYFKQY